MLYLWLQGATAATTPACWRPRIWNWPLLASRQCSYGAGVEEFERELGLLVVRVARPNNGVMWMV